MRLREIDKGRYKSRLRVVLAAIVVALLVISLAVSTFVIQIFSTPEVSHFWHNLGGVIFAAVIVAVLLNKFRDHPYLFEVVYVWDLKQELNRIHRKLKIIEPKLEQQDRDALIIMNFMYRGSKQLYELDDNTITMDTLLPKLLAHEQKMQAAGISPSTDAYHPGLLDKISAA